MKKLIELYKEKSRLSKEVVDTESGLVKGIFSIKNELIEDLILALETVNNEFLELKRAIEVKTQKFYYYKCDKCDTLLESEEVSPTEDCESINDYGGICGGSFSIRLTEVEYLDYFTNK